MGPIGCPETSVRNCHHSLRNNPEERRPHLLLCWSEKIIKISHQIWPYFKSRSTACSLQVLYHTVPFSSRNRVIKINTNIILPIIVYGCETWCVTLTEEHCLSALKHRVLGIRVRVSEGGKNRQLQEKIMRSFMICTYRHTWRSWLKHVATSREVAVSMPRGVIGIFHSLNLSGRTMALESTQPLTKIISRDISWGVKAADTYGWQPCHFSVPKSGSLNLLEP
jgi:hypothetical protein